MQLANGMPFGLFGPPPARPRTVGGAAGFSPGVPTPGNTPSNGFFGAPATYRTPGIGDGLPGAQPVDDDRAPVSLMPLDAQLSPVGNLPQLAPLPGVKPKQPAFFGEGGTGRNIVGAIADAVLQMNGARPIWGPAMQEKRQMAYAQQQRQAEWDRQDAQRQQDHQYALEDRDWKAKQKRFFSSGRDQIAYDPVTGESQVVYDGPTDFEEYANLMNLEPGSDEYNEAMQDYVLRANGPTALAGRQEMETQRQGNRVSLEGVRQSNRAALRGMPTYANLHPRPAGGAGGGNRGGPPRTTGNVYAPILAKMAAGQALSPGEQQVIGMYGRGSRGGKSAGAPSGGGNPIATDGKGNKVRWDGKAWRPVG